MFGETAEALAAQVTEENYDKGLIYPPFTKIRKISAHIAANVAAKAYELGELYISRDLYVWYVRMDWTGLNWTYQMHEMNNLIYLVLMHVVIIGFHIDLHCFDSQDWLPVFLAQRTLSMMLRAACTLHCIATIVNLTCSEIFVEIHQFSL